MDTALTVWKADILRGCGKRCADRKQKILKSGGTEYPEKIPQDHLVSIYKSSETV